MKFAFVINTFPALSETFILSQITGLVDRGHEVDILAFRPTWAKVVHPDVRRYNLLKQTFYAVPSAGSRTSRALRGTIACARRGWRRPDILCRVLAGGDARGSGGKMHLLFRAASCLGRGPYDVIHCHYGPVGIDAQILRRLGALGGRVLGVVFHGFDMSSVLQRHGEGYYQGLSREADLLLPVSQRWRKRLADSGCDDRKIRVHRMGIDVSAHPLIARRPEADGRVNVLTIARLVPKKAVGEALLAFAKVAPARPQVRYKIAGDGPLRNELEQTIDRLGLRDRVSMLGWRDQDEIRKLLEMAHIYFAPSVTGPDGDQEGIPMAIMEAMAAGLPVLSTQHSGIPELVEDGRSGFVVPEHDVDALAERLAFLIDHTEGWPEMGRAGRAHVEAEFEINALNDRLVEIYRQAIADAESRR